MTLDEMRAHRDALADELRFWEMAQRGFKKGPAMVAALRWALQLADSAITAAQAEAAWIDPLPHPQAFDTRPAPRPHRTDTPPTEHSDGEE